MKEYKAYGIPKLDINDYIHESHHELIPKWKQEGKTDKWIYEQLGISVSTGHKWKNRHPWFKQLFEKGKAELLEKLENSLINRALGREDKEVVVTYDENGDVSEKKVKTKTVQSETAIMTLLARYDPNTWSKKALTQDADDISDEKVTFGGEDEL